MQLWNATIGADANEALPEPKEELPPGSELPRRDWVTLNRARAKVGKTRDNLHRWGYTQDTQCPCGAELQTMAHILDECPLSVPSSDADLRDASATAREWITRWSDKI